MARSYDCDYCGEPIDGKPAQFIEYEHRGGRTSIDFQYHLPCRDVVVDRLEEIARWAHREEGSEDMEWRLFERGSDDRMSPVSNALQRAEWDRKHAERERRAKAGTRISALARFGVNRGATRALFWQGDIVTIEELTAKTEAEVRAVPSVGPRSWQQIQDALVQLGLSLRENTAVEG